MQDSVIPTLCSALGAYYRIGGDPPRTGNHHQARAIAPYNIYRTSDGYVAIICMRDRHWQQLVVAMGREEMVTDTFVETWSERLTTDEVFSICQTHEVVCAAVQSLDDVLNDRHLVSRSALHRLSHPTIGDMMIPSTPLRFTAVDPPKSELPRKLGADNERIYGEFLGLSPKEVRQLRDSSTI